MLRIFSFVVLALGLGAGTAHSKGPKKLTSASQETLISCVLLGQMNTYSLSKKRQLSLKTCKRTKGKYRCKYIKRGIFRSGWRSMTWDFRLSQCISKVLARPALKTEGMKAVAKVAGVPLFRKPKTQGAHYYNPALFRWLAKWIPAPNIALGDYEYLNIYNVIFRRHIRITAYTYLYLKQPKAKALIKEYLRTHAGTARATRPQQRLVRAKIKKALGSLVTDPISGGWHFDAGDAAMFWMRRKIDGSEGAVWALLSKVMQSYDPAFLHRIKKQKSFGKIQLKLPGKQPFHRSTWTAAQPSQVGVAISQTNDRVRTQLHPGLYKMYGIELPEDVSGNGKLLTRHVTVEGIGKGKAIIQTKGPKSAAFFIENARDIIIRKLHIRYKKPKKGAACTKQIFRIKRARRIWIDKLVFASDCPLGFLIENSQDVVISRVYMKANIPVAFKAIHTKRLWLFGNTLKNSPRRIKCHLCTWALGRKLKKSWSFAQSIKKKLGLP